MEQSLKRLENRSRWMRRVLIAGVAILQLAAVMMITGFLSGSGDLRLVSGVMFTLGATLMALALLMRNEDKLTLEELKQTVRRQECDLSILRLILEARSYDSAHSSPLVAEAVRAKSPLPSSSINVEVPPGWKVSCHGSNGSEPLSQRDPSDPPATGC